MSMSPVPSRSLLGQLRRTPDRLEEVFGQRSLDPALPPPGGGFSLVEHLWHLAEIEREGFGERIARLVRGGRPFLPDFDGDRLAREREYRRRDPKRGLALFREARVANLRRLRGVPARAWSHAGTQEGVGVVRLRDIPRLMRDHDESHQREIEELVRSMPGRSDGHGAAAGRNRTGGGQDPSTAAPIRWHLLIHQLPPRPLYLRAKIRTRLARVGSVALKNSVYVLPNRDDCLEDLQWIAQEAASGGGEAYLCTGQFRHGVTDEELVQRFRQQSRQAYAALTRDVAEVRKRWPGRGGDEAETALTVQRLKKRLDEAGATDFFGAPGRKEAERMLRSLEPRRTGRTAGASDGRASDLRGRVWVTRPGVKVDRIASAWLVRRFVDPRARFRFAAPEQARRPREVRFDMAGGDFTHEGDRCTFESLLARLGVEDPALTAIAEIVHDIDLKDGKYGRADAAGVRRVIEGLVHAHPDDRERLERGLALFDDLYASFKSTAAPAGKERTAGRGAGRRTTARRTRR
jgi:hypothetical protein